MPQIIILAGPNGAGKSTAAPFLLRPEITFVNADEIAKGLTEMLAAERDFPAGRLALRRLDALEKSRADIAIETTLASRSLAPRIARLRHSGYCVYLFFLWLPNPELAIQRVAERVHHGGHSIPEDVIRRRYAAGLRNFFQLYRPLADVWRLYDTSQDGSPKLIARELIARRSLRVENMPLWNQLQEEWHDAPQRTRAYYQRPSPCGFRGGRTG